MKKLSVILCVLISFFGIESTLIQAQTPAQTSPGGSQLIEKVEATSNPLIIPYEKWKLPNGLTVIIHEDHSDPIVALTVTYHVGSARERLGQSGFAHFFEHMMFEGSGHVGGKAADKMVSEEGGEFNAFTQRDKTTYFELLPANKIEVAMWIEADKMGFLLDSVTKERFENQRATVKNEKGQNVENQPYGLATEEVINQTLYPNGHPYSWPVIGYTDDLDRVTVDDLRNFFLRWYGPNNAVLSVAGDVNSKDVLVMAEKYFGPLKACPEVKKVRMPAPVLPTDKYANYIDNIYLPMTLMVYPTVPAYHRDEAALDLLGAMMGEGKNSVFYKNFVKAEKAEVQVGHNGLEGPCELSGEFVINVLAYPDNDINPEDIPADKDQRERWMHKQTLKGFDETEKLIHSTIDEFEKTGMTDSSLQRAKAKKETEIVNVSTTILNKAIVMGEWQTYIGKPYNLKDEMERYDKVTVEDIQRVFAKYIKDKHAAIVNVFPKDPDSKDSVKSYNPNANIKITPDPEYSSLKYDPVKDNFDRNKKPSSLAPKLPVVPQYYSHDLKNGLKIIGTRDAETPSVVIYFTINGGDVVFGDQKKYGIANLTASMLEESTKNYTSEQISAELDKLGSTIDFRGDRERSTIYVNCLVKNLDATLKLLEEKLLRPKFDAADFKRVKKQQRENLTHERTVPQTTARKLYRNLLFGPTALGAYDTEKSLKKLSLDDVKSYYGQFYSPSAANVVVVGDVSEDDVMKKLSFLNQWQGKEVKMPQVTGLPQAQQTQIYLCDKPGAAQSIVMVGELGMTYDATGEFFKANTMNFALGGGFSSRLNMNLREDKGYTYGINSYFSGSKYPGTFTVFASVKRNATDSCVTEIMKELKSYSAQGMKDDEVSFTKNSILNSQVLNYESPFQKAEFLSDIVQYNLPKDFTSTQEKIVKDLTKNDFNSLSAKYINPDKMVILVVGNRYFIKDKLDKLGYGKVKEIELD